jgi:hypothetical protein
MGMHNLLTNASYLDLLPSRSISVGCIYSLLPPPTHTWLSNTQLPNSNMRNRCNQCTQPSHFSNASCKRNARFYVQSQVSLDIQLCTLGCQGVRRGSPTWVSGWFASPPTPCPHHSTQNHDHPMFQSPTKRKPTTALATLNCFHSPKTRKGKQTTAATPTQVFWIFFGTAHLSLFSQLHIARYIFHELILMFHFCSCDLEEARSVLPWTWISPLPCEFAGLLGIGIDVVTKPYKKIWIKPQDCIPNRLHIKST